MNKNSKNVAGLIDESELLALAGDEISAGTATVTTSSGGCIAGIITSATAISAAIIAATTQGPCPTSACTKECKK